ERKKRGTRSATRGGSLTRRQSGGMSSTAASATVNRDSGDSDARCARRYSRTPVFRMNASIAAPPFKEEVRFDYVLLLVCGLPAFSGVVLVYALSEFNSLLAQVLLVNDAVRTDQKRHDS